ncbi:hypothetical protein M3595_09230 [Staphylococcus warneri]|jgi:uncharacterized membrane protein YhaH (DUF805 family)|uniref:DUF805 domain-containing protein n=1 Tax=Staphylococcus warneri TaxID=1292 RepID=A0A364USP2_STAWA|nr:MULTISPECIES: hypothetical protein [Staphylococcus]AGC91644.1 hypothetical protein A284_11655 [Staphylococcus warneri SG1]MBJ7886460.1 hypothetical protein [Bacillaceae bacterium HSR45]PAK72986.1 hypothetical protein B8W95_06855 [Staphylococcus pasteuri]EGG97021.1 hypothetical protein SEVCU121_1291 [Staphylococcus warneri VCU121]KEK50652.1 putative membrane protein [Staphylococcus warneri Lyso 1 2011]
METKQYHIVNHYIDFWANSFNYQEETSRQGFWIPTIINTLILILEYTFVTISYDNFGLLEDFSVFTKIILMLIPLIMGIAQIALTQRRFNNLNSNNVCPKICGIAFVITFLAFVIDIKIIAIFTLLIYLITALINVIIASRPTK